MNRRSFLKTTALAAGVAPLLLGSNPLPAAGPPAAAGPALDLAELAGSHDLRLPEWGCYTNLYNGLAHMADQEKGLNFELSVFPAFYRREVLVPNVKHTSGYHPWEAAADLSYFAYRYELQWKDQVYVDVSFSQVDDVTRLIRAEFVNRTEAWQNAALHFMACLRYPTVRPYADEIQQRFRAVLPEGAVWGKAVDYLTLDFATPRPADGLVPSGLRRAEVRGQGYASGTAVASGFGKAAGDRLTFAVTLPQALSAAALLVRYRMKGKAANAFQVGGAARAILELAPAGEFALARTDLGSLAAGRHELELVSRGGGAPELDAWVVAPAGPAGQAAFEEAPLRPVPQILEGPVPRSVLLKYEDLERFYGIAWEHDRHQIREFHHSELDRYFRRQVNNHVSLQFHGDDLGHFTNIFLRPVALEPGARRVLYGLATVGRREAVEAALQRTPVDRAEMEARYEKARARRFQFAAAPQGEPYRFSQERMAATLLTNALYPIYVKRKFVRHYTPGKWWDSLYTWDCGFTGLALAELDLRRAVESLNSYTTEPGDPHSAFIHVGTPLPVQIFQFWELWNRTQSREVLAYFYPRVRQFHNFLAGRHTTSNTRRLKSGLLTTWSYFYNTGWDDYPPQQYMHAQKLTHTTAAVITTAHAIRTAKMLRVAARALGQDADLAAYDEEIARWTNAIQTHCWDASSGYYSYVLHDADLQPAGILRHPDGQNYNMGMDGVTPIIAGIGTDEQFQAQLGNLRSGQHLWTPIGLSTVDQSAAYYRKDGYWNGAVWMPHQWFVWKSLLDWGGGDFAWQIARTALDLWRDEVNESYHCFEHFLIESRRGAGWHQFSSLSAPVLNWYAAYYVPGRLTTGFDAWTRSCQFTNGNRGLTAELEISTARAGQGHVVASLAPGGSYRVSWSGRPAAFKEILPGVLQIEIPTPTPAGRLTVEG